jgi:hypothetical protein
MVQHGERERERERKVPGVRAQHWAASRGKGPKAKGRREMVWRQRTRMFVSGEGGVSCKSGPDDVRGEIEGRGLVRVATASFFRT